MILNNMVTTQDGSHTLYSEKYNQHFHNTEDGAINEALNKHIIPAFDFHKSKKELNILDICYGLGYNTLASIFYVIHNNLDIKLNIFSPELDFELVKSLKKFQYPKEFLSLNNIIESLSSKQKYEDENFKIEVCIKDARAYIKDFENNFFDIVYQDAFSSDVNMELWTKEYFDDIFRVCKNSAIMTSYAISTNIRLSMYEAGFYIYEQRPLKRKITLAFKQKQNQINKYIDMELKKQRNKEARALYDN